MNAPSAAVVDWLTRLVACDTTSRASNRALTDAIAEYARGLGAQVRTFPSADGLKDALVVTVPGADGAVAGGVGLAGHTDCVPVDGQDWASDPFTLTERDGRLHGRGTADMKGFLACALAALPAFVAAPLRRPVHLVFSYDEELGCLGAEPLMAAMGEAGVLPEVGFVGEPSSMLMVRGHKAVTHLRVVVAGRSAHSSMTHLGVNAIEYAAQVVTFWRGIAERWASQGPFDDDFPLSYSSASVNQIVGGNAPNTVADRCEIVFDSRTVPAVDVPALLDELRAFCRKLEARMRAEHADAAEASIEVIVDSSATALNLEVSSLAIALGHEAGLELAPGKVTYGTEAGIYTEAGFEAVVVGPGDIAVAHRPDEYVELVQLARCEAFMGRLAEQLRV